MIAPFDDTRPGVKRMVEEGGATSAVQMIVDHLTESGGFVNSNSRVQTRGDSPARRAAP
jgi:hypothetical protein